MHCNVWSMTYDQLSTSPLVINVKIVTIVLILQLRHR